MSEKDPSLFFEVFNQRAAILTFFGALGGSVRAAVLKTTWREGLRVVFVGGAVAFGVGVLGPVLMKPWIGDLPDEMAGAMGTLTAASFLIGLVAVTLVERFISGESNEALDAKPREYGPEGRIPAPEENQ
ncbi:hypothetical protein vBRpoPV13_68 [Ruegeria phage vB_RpoP-V13]|uniref:Uncharacterized protein n=1 Tax=Ruegeria phage vB_RpoP-V13 TaxID=2218612 RepID=A0A2Z4QGP6_9CAUD|nr:hypothetical protein HYP63_gp68 [Ruegeria phage vB_RpoP-V13]AWY09425.1 hypothetical protein vBRpoPV13_68 [Ruegeria phage vB_RpoP-V13]